MNNERITAIRNWFLFFLIYSFIGYVYEVSVYYFELHEGFVNRGFLFGPYIPVYGFGGLLIMLSMRKLKERKISVGKINLTPLVIFIGVVLLTSSVELLTSYLMEAATGGWLWDYTNDGPNFQGRIAVKSSVRFGIIGVVVLYIVQPQLEKAVDYLSKKFGKVFEWTSILLILCFLADVIARFFLGSNS